MRNQRTNLLPPNSVIDRYVIEDVIGRGSMGDVYCVTDRELNRRAALKILSDRHRHSKDLYLRFVREARSVAAISHPNVVQVFTTGTYEKRPYIVMEYLEGIDLGKSVAQSGAWQSLAAARAIRDASHGLAAAATAGLIHRDVKPTNLVQLRDGTIKVTDFGLVRPMDPSGSPALTAKGVVVGTPDYIAPEQARGTQIDERVDIYALGGTLYFLLVGRPPFRTGIAAKDEYLLVVARHLNDPIPDPRRAPRPPGSPPIDRELGALAMKLLAKKPQDRLHYPELQAQLDTIVVRLQSVPKTVPVSDSLVPTPVSADVEDLVIRKKRTLRPWIITAISATLFVIGVVLTLFG